MTDIPAATSDDMFTAVAQITRDGETLVSGAIAFDSRGVTLIADTRKKDDGQVEFVVRGGPPRTPGFADLEKTCVEPVVFMLFRNGEPMQKETVANLFKRTTLDLGSLYR